MNKLSPSAISDFLRSPRRYYWRHVFSMAPGTRGIEPTILSAASYDHDRIAGICWSAFVARFYSHIPLDKNIEAVLSEWHDAVSGWLETKLNESYATALTGLGEQYYAQFRPDDGARTVSEGWLEDDYFLCRPDGLTLFQHPMLGLTDINVHECKLTSQAENLSAQLWKYQNSIQTKLYAVLAGASGICVELAFKDKPRTASEGWRIVRAPVRPVTSDERGSWERELRSIAEAIRSTFHFPCHPEGCSIIGKRMTNLCPYKPLCDGDMSGLGVLFRPRVRDKETT